MIEIKSSIVTMVTLFPTLAQSSFDNIQSWVQELRQLGPADMVLAIAGNKADLAEDREVTYDQ